MNLDTPLDYALAYAQAGYSVIPVRGKIPRTERGSHDASKDETVIRAWFTNSPTANIGMTLDGLVAVDIDPRNGGDVDTLPHPLPDTCYAKTGGGGFHYLYRARNGTKYPGTLGAGIDVKHGAGAYIVVEPSIHASGEKYCWLDESEPWTTPPADAPDWLAKSDTPKAETEQHGDKAVDLLANIADGNALHDSTCALAAHYVGKGLAFGEVCKLLENALHASKAPHDERWHARFDAIPGLVNSAIEKFRSPNHGAPEIIVKCSPLDWPALADRNPPLRQWAIFGWLGFFINLLVGSGGIGKTLLAQQMGSALALGRAFIDAIERELVVLMWACEDDHDELWRRQVQIASFFGVGIEAFRDKFIIMPRHGMENALMTTEFGRPMLTPLLNELHEQAADYRADVVILDNAAQLFGGSENDRHHVTLFQNALAGALSLKAVLLLAHPARSAGSEYAGSGAWENVARNRLFLGSHLPDQQPDADEQPDYTVRYLARRKANYSSKDYRRFQYRDGVLIPDEVEVSTPGGLMDHLRKEKAVRVILDGLGKLKIMEVRAAAAANSPAFLPRILIDYKLAEGYTKKELADAMRTAMLSGKLIQGVVGKYGNRGAMHGLVVAAEVCTK